MTIKKNVTLGEIARLIADENLDEAKRALVAQSEYKESPVSVVSDSDARRVMRTDVKSSEGIDYWSLMPPSLSWFGGYTILKVVLDDSQKDGFMYHPDIEYLIPLSGEVEYKFIVESAGESGPVEERTKPFGLGTAIRVVAQSPHHARAYRGTAVGLMVFGSEAVPSVPAMNSPEIVENYQPPRRVHLEGISSGELALIKWGISRGVSVARERAGLTQAALAKVSGVDPSYVSRLENASSDISMRNLLKITEVLGINIYSLLPLKEPLHKVRPWHIFDGIFNKPGRIAADKQKHDPFRIETRVIPLDERDSRGSREQTFTRWESWYVARGYGLVIMLDSEVSKRHLIEVGTAIHFAPKTRVKIEPLSELTILRISAE